jgi:hypothetical protein
MSFESVASAIGTLGSFAGGLLSSGLNYGLQRDQLNYQKNLQQQIFSREDTAVQRRAADLQAAGINKQLAAGSAANAGAVVNTSVPQLSGVAKNFAYLTQALALKNEVLNGRRTQADIDRLNAETEHINQQNRIISHDADIYADGGFGRTSKDSGLSAMFLGALTSQRGQDAVRDLFSGKIDFKTALLRFFDVSDVSSLPEPVKTTPITKVKEVFEDVVKDGIVEPFKEGLDKVKNAFKDNVLDGEDSWLEWLRKKGLVPTDRPAGHGGSIRFD